MKKEQAAYQTCRKYSNFQRKGKLSFPIRHFVSAAANKWKIIAGPMIARESYISFEKKQTLYITVTNSVWMNHLYMMKADLLKRIREDDYGKSTQIYASLRAGRKSNAPRNPLSPL